MQELNNADNDGGWLSSVDIVVLHDQVIDYHVQELDCQDPDQRTDIIKKHDSESAKSVWPT